MKTWTATRTSLLTVIGAMGVLLLAVTFASAVPAGGSDQWAYGETYGYGYNCNTNCLTEDNITINQLDYHVFVGAAVIFNQVNNSASSFTVSVEKVLAAHASLQVSVTNDSSGATFNANATAQGLYKAYGNSTAITNSTVYVWNGVTGTYTPEPALGLQEADSNQVANGSISFTASGAGLPVNGGTVYEGATVELSMMATFHPSLGLVPANLYNGELWNSTSTYYASASGFVSAHSYVPCAYQTTDGGTCTSTGGTVNDSASSLVGSGGMVYVSGDDLGWWNVTGYNGVNYMFQVITLTFTGNIGTTDGILLIPGSAGTYLGLVQGGPVLTAAQHYGVGQVVKPLAVNPPDGLDYSSTSGNLGFEGSNSLGDLNDYSTAGNDAGGPEPTSVATQDFSSLQVPPTSSSAPSSNNGYFLLIVIVVVVAVVVVVLAVLMVRGKHRKQAVRAATPAGAAAPPPPPPASMPPQGPYYQPAPPAPAAPPPAYYPGQPAYPPPPPPR